MLRVFLVSYATCMTAFYVVAFSIGVREAQCFYFVPGYLTQPHEFFNAGLGSVLLSIAGGVALTAFTVRKGVNTPVGWFTGLTLRRMYAACPPCPGPVCPFLKGNAHASVQG